VVHREFEAQCLPRNDGVAPKAALGWLESNFRFTPESRLNSEIAACPKSADIVEKVFLGRRRKFLRAAGAFRARRLEGPHRFTQKRPPTFASALKGVAALEATTNAFSRDFWRRSIFDFFNNICQFRTHASQQLGVLFDHLVGARKQWLWIITLIALAVLRLTTTRIWSTPVLEDRPFLALEDAIDIACREPILVDEIWSVRYQAPCDRHPRRTPRHPTLSLKRSWEMVHRRKNISRNWSNFRPTQV
jgi:hypothetical protein